jgi:hypothetical protein
VTDRLAEAFVLSPTERRQRAHSRSAEVSMQGLRDLVDDELLGPAAREALRCVEGAGADPRLMLLVLEAADEGDFRLSDSPDAERQRRARRNGT